MICTCKRTICFALILGISLLLSSCSQSPIHDAQVQVAQEAPVIKELLGESLDIRNCQSNEDMVTSLAAKAPVRQEISISRQATVVETGSTIDISDEIHNELKWQVQNKFQPIFEEAVANAENVELIIPGLTIHVYRIQWIQRVYRSTISFSINEQACTASYVYTLDTPDLLDYTMSVCTA